MSDQAPTGESPRPSLSDRITAQFMPREPEPKAAPQPESAPVDEAAPYTEAASEGEAQEGASETAEDWAEVDYEGERYQVPPKLKEAIIQKADYTRKTQEVADQRRMVEYKEQALKLAESERQFAETVKDDITTIVTLDQQLAQFKNVDWASLDTDQAFRAKLMHDQLKDQKAALEAALNQKRGQWQEEVRNAHTDLIQKGLETLKRSIPNFGEAVVKEITEAAQRDGYTPEELSQIVDPRMIKTLWKAQQYDKLQASSTAAKAAVGKAAPLGKSAPGSRPMDDKTRNYLNYRKAVQKAGPVGSQQRQAIVKDRIADIFSR